MVNNRASLDAVYSALADPSRRLMVERLTSGPRTVSDLAAPLEMTLAAVGKHIAVLETAGIIRTSKSGRVRSCAVVPGALAQASGWLAAQEAFWTSRVDALASHLERNP